MARRSPRRPSPGWFQWATSPARSGRRGAAAHDRRRGNGSNADAAAARAARTSRFRRSCKTSGGAASAKCSTGSITRCCGRNSAAGPTFRSTPTFSWWRTTRRTSTWVSSRWRSGARDPTSSCSRRRTTSSTTGSSARSSAISPIWCRWSGAVRYGIRSTSPRAISTRATACSSSPRGRGRAPGTSRGSVAGSRIWRSAARSGCFRCTSIRGRRFRRARSVCDRATWPPGSVRFFLTSS